MFVQKYGAELDELKGWPDKVKINSLTMLAAEAAKTRTPGETAEDVVGIIQSRLFRGRVASYKLPILYVMDSIVWNAGGPYVTLFSKNLPTIFSAVFDTVTGAEQAKMKRLLYSWAKRPGRRSFPTTTLEQIKRDCFPGAEPLPARPVAPNHHHRAAAAPHGQQRRQRPSDNYRRPTPPMSASSSAATMQLPSQPVRVNPVRERMKKLLADLFDNLNASDEERCTLRMLEMQKPDLAKQLHAKAVAEMKAEAESPSFENVRSEASARGAAAKLLQSTEDRRADFISSQNQKTNSSRMWWLSTEEWIKGAAQVAAAVLSFFETQQLELEKKVNVKDDGERGVCEVVADENQKKCPLSGETFEEYWNDEKQEWMYKDAVRPDPNGPIYMVEALAAKRRVSGEFDGNAIPAAKRQKR